MLIVNAALDGILLIIPADCVKVSSRCKVEEQAPQQSACTDSRTTAYTAFA